MGGETGSGGPGARGWTGLSPRGRGNPGDRAPRRHPVRSIPAWAGKPSPATLGTVARTVYPRVGGETLWNSQPWFRTTGLSPRGRGNPISGRGLHEPCGSIPAWAGKPR